MKLAERVRLAQSGDKAETERLLKDFGWRRKGRWQGFLGKYDQLLWHGRADLRNKDTRRFLQLYLKDAGVRHKLIWRYQDYATSAAAQETANYLQNAVQDGFSREELRQELVCQFLDCLARYQEKPGVDFSGYLVNYYRYRVYRLLQQTVFRLDVLAQPNVFYPTDFLGAAGIDLQEGWFLPLYGRELLRGELGVFWTNGYCGPFFGGLTTFERVLLRDHYLYKQTDQVLAEKYGYHKNTIYNKRHKAIDKIKEKREHP